VTFTRRDIAALGLFTSLGIDGVDSSGNVVIDHLTPGRQQDGDGMIVQTQISVGGGRNGTRSGQFLTSDRHTGLAHTIGVGGGQESSEGRHGSTPVAVFQVVTIAVNGAETLSFARVVLHWSGADTADARGLGINQGQTRVDGIEGQFEFGGEDGARLDQSATKKIDLSLSRGIWVLGWGELQLSGCCRESTLHRLQAHARATGSGGDEEGAFVTRRRSLAMDRGTGATLMGTSEMVLTGCASNQQTQHDQLGSHCGSEELKL